MIEKSHRFGTRNWVRPIVYSWVKFEAGQRPRVAQERSRRSGEKAVRQGAISRVQEKHFQRQVDLGEL